MILAKGVYPIDIKLISAAARVGLRARVDLCNGIHYFTGIRYYGTDNFDQNLADSILDSIACSINGTEKDKVHDDDLFELDGFSVVRPNWNPYQRMYVLFKSVRLKKWKFIQKGTSMGNDLPMVRFYELYDIENDPNETNNIIFEQPEKARQLKDMLGEWRTNNERLAINISLTPPEIDDVEWERLRSLGYVI